MAKDTSVMAYTAEDLIAHKLQRAQILVAKPKFDQNGADLLGLLDVKDNAKFCRIQCKGRSFGSSGRSHVDVLEEYVTDGLVLFLLVETGDQARTDLFCFLGREIRANWRLSANRVHYRLEFTASKLERLDPFRFSDQRVEDIKKAIISIDVGPEFRTMGHGYIDAKCPMPTLVATGGPSWIRLARPV